MNSKYEKFDKIINLINNDINENYMIFIKEIMIKIMISWLYLINNILYYYYK